MAPKIVRTILEFTVEYPTDEDSGLNAAQTVAMDFGKDTYDAVEGLFDVLESSNNVGQKADFRVLAAEFIEPPEPPKPKEYVYAVFYKSLTGYIFEGLFKTYLDAVSSIPVPSRIGLYKYAEPEGEGRVVDYAEYRVSKQEVK